MTQKTPKYFGLKVRVARAYKGYTLKQLSAKSGLGLNTLHRYEVGDRYPYLSSLQLLAQALDVCPLWLMNGKPFKLGD